MCPYFPNFAVAFCSAESSIFQFKQTTKHELFLLQTLVPSTENPKGHGRSFIPQEQAVLFRNEPYMTSNNWYHRTFSKQELSGYPRRDAATYWQCEDYPKAWGHGTARNPLSKSMGDGTMRDRRLFKTATAVFRQPRTMHPTHK